MKESQIQTAIMDMLESHPKVAFVTVTTTGVVKRRGSWMTINFKGMSDIIGQMKDGRFLAIEAKAPGERPTNDQLAFLALVESNKGLAGWADSVEMAKGIVD